MFPIEQKMRSHVLRNNGIDKCVGGWNIDSAALINAIYDKGTVQICTEEPLCAVVLIIMLKQNLN